MYRDKTFHELVALWNRTPSEVEAAGDDPDGFYYPVAGAFCRFPLLGTAFLISQLPAEDSERGYALLLSGIRHLPVPREKRIEILLPYVESSACLLRVTAINALLELKAYEAKAAVEQHLNDSESVVRVWAVRFLTQLWPYDTVHLIETALQDRDPMVRSKAIEFISWSPDQSLPAKYEDRIWPMLDDDDESIRFEAIWFLMKQCPRDMFGRPDTRSPEATRERMRIFELFLARDNNDLDAIIAAAWDESPSLRREAARWIWQDFGGCADEFRAGTNDHLRNDPDPRVRAAFERE